MKNGMEQWLCRVVMLGFEIRGVLLGALEAGDLQAHQERSMYLIRGISTLYFGIFTV